MEMIQRRIKDEFGVSEHTIVNWMSFIREVCEKDIIDNPTGWNANRQMYQKKLRSTSLYSSEGNIIEGEQKMECGFLEP